MTKESKGSAAGDVVEAELELDDAPRKVTVPKDLAQALAADSDAKRRFEGLSYSHQRRWVLSIEEAKKPETRVRRIEKAVDALREEAAGRK